MDARETKTSLKNAREAIRQKEFKEALKHCKAVLSADSNNYMALVLIAVAAEGLEQYEQALKAYKRAIEADPSQILAWQGLCSFFEKNPKEEYSKDQTEAYLKMIEFHQSEREKKLEVLQKLKNLMKNSTDFAQLDKVIELYQMSIKEEEDWARKMQLQTGLISLFTSSQQADKSVRIEELCREILENSREYNESVEDIISTYLPLLMKRCPQDVKSVSSSLHEKFSESPTALQYMLIMLLDSYIGCLKFQTSEELKQKFELYKKLASEPDMAIVSAAEGVFAVCRKDYFAARSTLLTVKKSMSLVCVPYFEAVASYYLHKYEDSLNYCLTGLKILERRDRVLTIASSEATKAFQILRVMALYYIGDKTSLSGAMDVLENDLETGEIETVLKGKTFLKLGDVQSAKTCVVGDSAERNVLEGLIALEEGKEVEATERFQAAVDKEPDNAGYHVQLAKCLWKSEGRRQECFPLLLKAAKQDPYNPETFLYLGHYYNTVAGDVTRARKCYQKAYDLDPRSDEAGEALCDILNSQGEEEQAYAMLLSVTQKASAGCAKWAWLRLGLYQVKHDDPSVAIASFQSALRADPKDNHVWECLGEAYLARGSYTASLKAFTKSSELDPDSMYCLFKIASIKQTLGLYTEAVDDYTLVLKKSPNYVPALKGLGETYVLIAKSLLTRFFDGRARDTCQLAVQHLFRAVSCRPDLSCLWKLIGDACTMMHLLPAENFKFEKPDGSAMNKMETLELGGRCNVRALKILPECSSLWHDLGVNYIYQSQCSTGESSLSLAEKSVQALKKAIQLEPMNYKHWNALGYVACLKVYNRPDLAQHCFIKSVQVENNNVVAWTNLAALYLSRDNVELAHEAFKIAQSLEPSYVACWIGQAIIAELIGHGDAMDLFRHTTELGNHIEGSLGYGHWVCTTLLHNESKGSYAYTYAIEQMGAVPAASDALTRYTERVKTNAAAYNMHGLLLERQALYKTAAEQFKSAKQLLEKQAGKDQLLHDVTCNLARVLMKAGDLQEALSVYQQIADSCSFVDVCHFALALYKTEGLAPQSSQAYMKAAEMAPTEVDKADALTAIALALFKCGDLDNAKINLFHSSQSSPPSIHGIKALSAFGLLQSDVTLAEAALNELSSLERDERHIYDLAVLRVGVGLLKGNLLGVKRYLQKLLHEDPSLLDIWYLLSSVVVKYFPSLPESGAHAARTCLALEIHKSQRGYLLLTSGELGSGCHGNTHPYRNAFLTAQVAVHLFPEKSENWLNLIAGIHGEAVQRSAWEDRVLLLKHEYNLLKHMLLQDISLPSKLWCLKQRVICAVHADMQKELMECLDDLMTQFGSEADVKQMFDVFRNVLQGNPAGVMSVLDRESLFYYWQIVLEMYVRAGLMAEVDTVVQECMKHCSERETKVFMLRLAHVSFQLIMSQQGSAEHAMAIFKQTADQVLATDAQCSAVLLMQALLSVRDNPRLAKHQLHKVLECHVEGSRGHDLSVARQALIYVLASSKKDSELVQTVVKDAALAQDTATLQYYKSLGIEQATLD